MVKHPLLDLFHTRQLFNETYKRGLAKYMHVDVKSAKQMKIESILVVSYYLCEI